MKVYMVQAFIRAPYYKVVDGRLANVQPSTIIPRAFLSVKQARAFRDEVDESDEFYDCPIVIGVEIEPLNED